MKVWLEKKLEAGKPVVAIVQWEMTDILIKELQWGERGEATLSDV